MMRIVQVQMHTSMSRGKMSLQDRINRIGRVFWYQMPPYENDQIPEYVIFSHRGVWQLEGKRGSPSARSLGQMCALCRSPRQVVETLEDEFASTIERYEASLIGESPRFT